MKVMISKRGLMVSATRNVTIKRNDALDALSRFLRQRDLDLKIGKAMNFMISHEPGQSRTRDVALIRLIVLALLYL